MRHGRPIRIALAAAVTACALASASTAAADPAILNSSLPGPVAGTPVDLTVTARDAGGMIVGFGNGQGGFGLSACTIGPSGPMLSPGASETLSAPHTFDAAGAGTAGLKVLPTGCGGGASALQQVAYTVVRPGQQPRASVFSPAALLPLGQPTPLLPGLTAIPLTRIDRAPAGTPGTQTPSSLPGLPSIPGIPLTQARTSATCRHTGGRFRNTTAGQLRAIAALLCLTNAERTRRGLRPLRLDARLASAALRHSRAMYRRRFFAHTGPGSLSLVQRLRRAHYVPRHGRWLVGENLGFGRGRASSPLALHRAWMRSTDHRENILNPRFRNIGFGVTRQSPFGRGATYTVDFGTRR